MRRAVSRGALAGALLAALAAPAAADGAPAGVTSAPAAERELGVALGIAAGGDATVGGVRLGIGYLHQLADADWFDGGLAFSLGSGAAACFRDRADRLVCDHGFSSGVATDLVAGVRRFVAVRRLDDVTFAPWVRGAVGVRLAHFPGDDLTGVAALVELAGGVRAQLLPWLAVGARSSLEVGAGWFTPGAGVEAQRALAIAATVDFGLR